MAFRLWYFLILMNLILPLLGESVSCNYKKKVIIDVNTSGMGNRIFAIISGVALAMYLNRELEINWVNSESCQASYSDLFEISENVMQQGALEPVQKVPLTECKLRLSQHKKFYHFWVLVDDELLQKLDKECDIIYALSNQWFAPIFYTRKMLDRNQTLLQRHPHPFKSFMQCLFVPNSRILDDVAGLMERFKGIRWLSVHARGFFDGGKGTARTLQCAQRLIEKKVIQQVLFVTDSQELEALARRSIEPKYLSLVEKQTVPPDIYKYNRTLEGNYIRDAMETALAEWFMIGEADFCMSPTFFTSTFTRSAMSRGKCKFMNPFENDCGVYGELRTQPKIIEVDHKIKSMVTLNASLNAEERKNIWMDVEKYVTVANPVCTGPTKKGSIILDYNSVRCDQ